VDKFVEVLELHYYSLFGDAMYALNLAVGRCQQTQAVAYNVARMQELLSDPYKMWTPIHTLSCET